MTDEPILPFIGEVTTVLLDDAFVREMVDVGASLLEHGDPVVVVPLDRASWDAMVERASSAKDITNHVNPTTRKRLLLIAERALRRALNLPDGWTP